MGTGSRSEKIKTYNYKDSRLSDHRAKANFALDGILAGDLDECIDTMVLLDQQEQLQVASTTFADRAVLPSVCFFVWHFLRTDGDAPWQNLRHIRGVTVAN